MSDEIARIVTAQKEKNARAAERRVRRLAEARHEAARLAEEFVRVDRTVRRVVLFGSVATGRVRSERFDIDLAVEADDYFSLLRAAELSSFRVDVVDLRSASTGFARRVLDRGVVLYGPER